LKKPTKLSGEDNQRCLEITQKRKGTRWGRDLEGLDWKVGSYSNLPGGGKMTAEDALSIKGNLASKRN